MTEEVQEIKLRPNYEPDDLAFKTEHARRLLREGHTLRLVVVFRGAEELARTSLGVDVLMRIAERCSDLATVVAPPILEGRRMRMLLAPKLGT